jgi:hypothetical protein
MNVLVICIIKVDYIKEFHIPNAILTSYQGVHQGDWMAYCYVGQHG